MRKTKIICTLGPATDKSENIVRDLMLSGMNVARFNFSHQTHEEHKRRLDTIVRLREGRDVTLLGCGILVNELLAAAELLAAEGVQAEVLKLNRIAPLDAGTLSGWFETTRRLLVLEDSMNDGCVGQRVSAILAEAGCVPPQVILKNMGKTFAPEGSVPELYHSFGLDAAGVAEAVREAMHRDA